MILEAEKFILSYFFFCKGAFCFFSIYPHVEQSLEGGRSYNLVASRG